MRRLLGLLGLPQPMVPIFFSFLFLEATYGSYMSVWPLWIEKLGAPITLVGIILGANGFLRLFVLIPSSAIAERFGVRRTILVSRGIAGLTLLTAAAATDWTHLAPMVIGTSISPLVFPLLQAIAASHAGERGMRSLALVFSVGPSIALIVSPLISGVVVAIWGMRAAFVLGAIFTLAALACMSRIAEPEVTPKRADEPNAGYRATMTNPNIRIVVLMLLVTVFSLSLGISFIPNFLEDVRGMDPATITSLSAVAAIGSASFGLIVARVRRLQRSPFVAVAIAIGLMTTSFAIFHSTAAMPLIVIAFLCRGGLFSAWAMLAGAIGEFATPEQRTRAFALCEMVGGSALAIGPMVAGPIYTHRPTLPFEISIALAVVLIPVSLLIHRRLGERPHPASVISLAEPELGTADARS